MSLCAKSAKAVSTIRIKISIALAKKNRARIERQIKGDINMDCPWYLGLHATEECIRTCPINADNRNSSICPECIDDESGEDD